MDHHEFTKKYMEILSDVLGLREKDGNRTFRWSNSTPHELERRLGNHFQVYTEDALKSIKEVGDDKTVSFHYGYSPDPSETLKYAPLYTDCVVMQDIIYRFLNRDRLSGLELRQTIQEYATEVKDWERLIEDNRVIIVPSPGLWSQDVRDQLPEIPNQKDRRCAPTLYAANKMGSVPFTDSPQYGRRMQQIGENAVGLRVLNDIRDGEIEKFRASVDMTWDEFNRGAKIKVEDETYELYQETLRQNRINNILAYLLGEPGDELPNVDEFDFFYRTDYDYEDVLELSREFRYFREDIADVLTAVRDENDRDDVIDILESATQIRDEYERIKERKASERKKRVASAGVTGFASLNVAIPLYTGFDPESLLLTLRTLSGGVVVAHQFKQLVQTVRRGDETEHEDLFRVLDRLEEQENSSTPLQFFSHA